MKMMSGDFHLMLLFAYLHTFGRKDIASMTAGQNKTKTADKENDEGLLKEFFSRPNLHPLLLSFVLHFLQNWSGVNVIVFKTVDVFETVGSSIDKYVCTAIVGGVQLVATGSKKTSAIYIYLLTLYLSIHRPGGHDWKATTPHDLRAGDDCLHGVTCFVPQQCILCPGKFALASSGFYYWIFHRLLCWLCHHSLLYYGGDVTS